MMTIKNFVFTSALIGSVLATTACAVEEDDVEYDDDDDYSEDDKSGLGAEPDEIPDPSLMNDNEPSLPEPGEGGAGQLRVARADWGAHLRCIGEVADRAYVAGDPGPIKCLGGPTATYEAQYSTEVMKVWRWGGAPNQTLIVSFKGTRITNLGDDLRDFQNIFKSQFASQLLEKVKYPGSIGAGWFARWKNQAPKLKPGIDDLVQRHATNNKHPVQLIITGHSMGGAIAAVAGYDVAKYLNTKGLKSRGVFVYAFNPAKIGTRTMMDSYGAALINRGGNRLFYRQFIRAQDPVHNLGPGLHHPVWNTTQLSRKIGTGKWTNYALSYCPQYVAPAYGGKISSHSMEMWHKRAKNRDADLNTMPRNHLTCMGGIF